MAIVIGGLSAELNLKTVKMASTRYYDNLHTRYVYCSLATPYSAATAPELSLTSPLAPHSGNEHGRAFRDLEWEQRVHKLTQKMGIGAQFGGKYFCHDVRVIRLPRHGASCPIGLGVSCSADRQVRGRRMDEVGSAHGSWRQCIWTR